MIESYVLSAVAITGTIVAGSFSAAKRFQALRDRKERLRFGQHALMQHYAALERLDDPEMPYHPLELALRFSECIHHPKAAQAIMNALIEDQCAFDTEERTAAADDRDAEWHEAFMRRPDLYRAFVDSIGSGIVAFVARWPGCERAFMGLAQVLTDPVSEAQQVVKVAARAGIIGTSTSPRRVPVLA